MKRFLLGVLLTASLCGCVKAANPSFSSFATNHFITNNFLIRARLNPSQFDTNASAITITITNIAGVPGGGTLWTNSAGNYVPNTLQDQLTATNIIGSERLQAAGAFILQALIGYALDPGLNDISALTNSVLWITGFDSDPANSSLRLDSGNGQGHILIVQNFADNSGFTMRNGEALFNSAPGSFQILNGDWVTSTKGDSLLLYNNGQSWAEIGRMSGTTNNTGSSLWESVAGVLRPLGHSLGTNQFTIAESTGWTGSGTNAFFDDGTFSGVAMINQTDGAIAKRANAYELEDLAAGVGLLNNDGTNNFSWIPISSISDGTNTAVVQLGPFTPGRYPIANGTNTLTDGSFYASGTTNVALDVPMVFGPGDTNVLYRSGTDLVYTNGANEMNFVVKKGDGSSGSMRMTTGSHLLVLGGSGSSVYLGANNNGSGDYVATSAAWSPVGKTSDLGSSANSWKNIYLTNQIIFGPGTTNVIARDGQHLLYENSGANGVYLRTKDSSGNIAQFGVIGLAGKVIGPTGGSLYLQGDAGASTSVVAITSSSIQPATAGAITLGVQGAPWNTLALTNTTSTNYIYFGTNIMAVIGSDLYWNGSKLNP